jgi:hypothetical protein
MYGCDTVCVTDLDMRLYFPQISLYKGFNSPDVAHIQVTQPGGIDSGNYIASMIFQSDWLKLWQPKIVVCASNCFVSLLPCCPSAYVRSKRAKILKKASP